MSKLQRCFLLLLCPAILTAVLSAQARPSRSLTGGWGDGLTLGSAMIVAESSGIRVTGPTPTGERVSAVLSTAIEILGAYDVIGGPTLTGLVVAGATSQGGRVESWALNGTNWSMTSSLNVPGTDFTGVARVGPYLYLLDRVSRTVLRALWTPQENLASTSLEVYITQVDLPALSDASLLLMYGLEAGEAQALPGPGLFLFSLFELNLTKWGHLVRDTVNGLAIDGFVYSRHPGVNGVVAIEEQIKAGDSMVMVSTNGPQSFEIVSQEGNVIGAATGPLQGGAVQTMLSEPLELGKRYTARLAGDATGATFVPLQRVGFPEQFADGSALQRVTIAPADYRVNNAEFSISAQVVRPGCLGPQQSYFGAMTLGLADTPIAPFDNGQGINELLLASYWVGALGEMRLNAKYGYVKMTFPIPNDPTWVGLVILGQFIVFDSAGFRLSEIVGFKILP
jgi:hypothetical protein